MTSEIKHLQVAAIKNGSVIDHITAGHALKLIRLLNLASKKTMVTVGLNLPSKLMTYKDIIKVEGRALTPEEAGYVALFAPHATINIIANYQVVKKMPVKLPKTIRAVVVCPNTTCVSNSEPMASLCLIEEHGEQIALRCHYCNKVFGRDEIAEYRI